MRDRLRATVDKKRIADRGFGGCRRKRYVCLRRENFAELHCIYCRMGRTDAVHEPSRDGERTQHALPAAAQLSDAHHFGRQHQLPHSVLLQLALPSRVQANSTVGPGRRRLSKNRIAARASATADVSRKPRRTEKLPLRPPGGQLQSRDVPAATSVAQLTL